MKSARNNQPTEKTKWYSIDKRTAFITSRVIGLNLLGKPQKFFFLKELQSTIFLLEFNIFCYSWKLNKSFDELREFNNFVINDRSLLRGKDLLKAPFPAGKDGEVDVMILVERREMIEAYLKDVVNTIDFEMYDPLNHFIDGTKQLQRLLSNLAVIIRFFRLKLAKKKLLSRLYRFYSKELMDFVYTMENGIELYNIDPKLPPESLKKNCHSILWLDVCEEPGLSRLCIAPKEIFELPKEFEDERLAYGVFLSDIAEVRRGVSSVAFSNLPPKSLYSSENPQGWLKADNCVSIVGSERTLSVQFLATIPSSATATLQKRSAATTSKLHVKSGFEINRLLFCDMLSLLVCQSLSNNELKLRNRHYRRYLVHPVVRTFPTQFCEKQTLSDGQKTAELLIRGIDIEVEATGPHPLNRHHFEELRQDSNTANRFLRYDAAQQVLIVNCGAMGNNNEVKRTEEEKLTNIAEEEEGEDNDTSAEEAEDDEEDLAVNQSDKQEGEEDDEEIILSPDNIHSHWWFTSTNIWHSNATESMLNNSISKNNDIVIPLDDLAEIRPGKVSSVIDSADEFNTCISFVSSTAVIVLPLGSISLRNTLLRKFQSFLLLNRNHRALFEEDVLSSFTPRNTSPDMANYRPPIINLNATLTTSHTVHFNANISTPTKAPAALYHDNDEQNIGDNSEKKKKKSSGKKHRKKKAAFDVPIGATPVAATAPHRFVTPMSSYLRGSSSNPNRVSVSSIRRSSTSSRGTFSVTPSLNQQGVLATGSYNAVNSNSNNNAFSQDDANFSLTQSDSFTPYRNLSVDY